MKTFWSKEYAPWLTIGIILIILYIVLVDTNLPDGIVGGF